MVRFLNLTGAAPVYTFARAGAILKEAPPYSWCDDSSNMYATVEPIEILESLDGLVGVIFLSNVPQGNRLL